jgi:flagellar motility protein MotE (MotC chaperone)
MIRFRNFRLIPVVLAATICLFALKALGIAFDGGYLFDHLASRRTNAPDLTGTVAPSKRVEMADGQEATVAGKEAPKSSSQPSWAQQMFNYPDLTGATGESKAPTGEAKAPPKDEKQGAKDGRPAKPQEPPPNPNGTLVPPEPERSQSPAERAILERLQERRVELDTRARELEMRESLLKAAEKRLEGRIGELKEIEARINAATQQKEEGEAARFKNLVSMYENMKAKDAAKIFDRLDLKVLVDVATQINPRRMSDVLGLMSPEAAEKLTLELAARGGKDKPQAADLPKIEGRPAPN